MTPFLLDLWAYFARYYMAYPTDGYVRRYQAELARRARAELALQGGAES